jgi:iron-sulfur cluster repair protein YtfE (RIC family)
VSPDDDRDPFARLESTHRRLEERLEELADAARDVSDPALRPDAIDGVHRVLAFFDRGGARHVEDEEQTLFPRLVALPDLAAIVAELEREHREHTATEAALRELADGWDDEGPDHAGELRLVELVDRLRALYCTHIEREERDLFPIARRHLGEGVQAIMAEEMLARRQDRRR